MRQFMSTSLHRLLQHFRVIDGVDLAAIVATDGLLMESSASPGVDAEAIGAVAANGLALAEALGREVSKGSAEQLTLEYAEGLVMIDPLTPDAMLLILTDGRHQLGRVRFLMHKHHAAFVSAIQAI
jgi:predicted regulator of Ras-like GTPase activity (Roadblock/LC7/MglB family)